MVISNTVDYVVEYFVRDAWTVVLHCVLEQGVNENTPLIPSKSRNFELRQRVTD